MRLLKMVWNCIVLLGLAVIASVSSALGVLLVLASFQMIYLDVTIGNPWDARASALVTVFGTVFTIVGSWLGTHVITYARGMRA